jgi:DNA-binding NtrC family response regulator
MVAPLRALFSRHDMLVGHAPNLPDVEAMPGKGSCDAVALELRLPDGDGLPLLPKLRGYGNASESTVQKWESGAKRPSGPALKLLGIVQKHGLRLRG